MWEQKKKNKPTYYYNTQAFKILVIIENLRNEI